MKIRAEGKRITATKERSDKKVRIYPYLEKDLFRKIDRLSRACNVSPHELTTEILDIAMKNPTLINWLQDKHKVEVDDPFRIIPQIENGKVIF